MSTMSRDSTSKGNVSLATSARIGTRPRDSQASDQGIYSGDDGNRTHDPLLAKQVLCQLSYVPGRGEG